MAVQKLKMEKLTKLHKELKISYGAMKMEDLRAEHFNAEYEAELAVRKRVNKVGSSSRTGGAAAGEIEMLKKKVEADELGVQAWSKTQTVAAEIQLVEYNLSTLEKIMSAWVSNPALYTESLCALLLSETVEFENAFQLAGLDCRCGNPACEFPFEVDGLHRQM
ncbi:hypothetical protein M758_UG246400 [Ceratodon purpureus]|nr:hypothetical protein M758_UG246400 [Ceratodon purpureus]